jgi:ankyrin repeat protein
LLSSGADTHAKTRNGLDALMVAIRSGEADVISMLMAYNSNINTSDRNGKTALMLATKMKNIDVIRDLCIIHNSPP